MTPLRIGSAEPKALYMGASPVKRLCLGSTTIWEDATTPILPAAPTNGSGGAKTDRQAVSFTGASRTSTYHIYGTNIAAAGNSPVGLVIHLHGDGAQENTMPTGGTLAGYNQVAKSKGYLFVAPLSPDSTGTKTWWENTYSTNWLVALMNDLYAKYNIDKNRVWFTGYSGGAEAISYFMMSDKSNAWNAGGAILLAGGGADGLVNPVPAWTQFMKDNMEMHWVVGSRDSPAQGGDDGGFDAVAAATGGEAYHRAKGIKQTSLTILPGLDHYQAEPKGPEHLALHLK